MQIAELNINDVSLKINVRDIFGDLDNKTFVVVPTNCGWKRSGENVMGAGLAKVASNKYPQLSVRYGDWCRQHGHTIYLDTEYRVICAPSKRLNAAKPWMSWQGQADPDVVQLSYNQIYALLNHEKFIKENYKVRCVLLGIGNGKMSKEESAQLFINSKLNTLNTIELFTNE